MKNKDSVIKLENYPRYNLHHVVFLYIISMVCLSPTLISQQSFAEDYKLDICIENHKNVNNEVDVSIETENDNVQTNTVNINDETEELMETISGKSGDKVKVCLEESDYNSKYCQTKELPQDEHNIVKFELEYKD